MQGKHPQLAELKRMQEWTYDFHRFVELTIQFKILESKAIMLRDKEEKPQFKTIYLNKIWIGTKFVRVFVFSLEEDFVSS
jgi:hypothetical protein